MGAKYVLADSFKQIALKSLMVGRGKEFYETLEDTAGVKFEDLLKKFKEYAAKRRLEANIKHNDVDVGNVEDEKWSAE